MVDTLFHHICDETTLPPYIIMKILKHLAEPMETMPKPEGVVMRNVFVVGRGVKMSCLGLCRPG